MRYTGGGFNLGTPSLNPNAYVNDTLGAQSVSFIDPKQQQEILTQNRIATQDYVVGQSYPELVHPTYNLSLIHISEPTRPF